MGFCKGNEEGKEKLQVNGWGGGGGGGGGAEWATTLFGYFAMIEKFCYDRVSTVLCRDRASCVMIGS